MPRIWRVAGEFWDKTTRFISDKFKDVLSARISDRSPKLERSSFMSVGRRVDYAVRALSYVAARAPHTTVSKAEIERSQDIPSYYLSKIMKDLVAAGLLKSHTPKALLS